MIDLTHRSKDIEIMDDLTMSGELLIKTLDQLATINKWLGGNKIALNGVKTLLETTTKNNPIKIVDLGCGNGDILRKIADYGRHHGYKFQLLGIDANQATIDYAIQLSAEYPEIYYLKEDVLSPDFNTETYDIAICTLFLHHFEDAVALNLIQTLVKNARIGVIINDLHRHWLAYSLFKLVTVFFGNKMTKQDGLTSIQKAFKRKDLEEFSKSINHKITIKWRWAFRYQWIINKL